ncbi:MAG: alpha-L-rhamnosidase C-terminal domain-containing protein [Chloroflexota bacterium]
MSQCPDALLDCERTFHSESGTRSARHLTPYGLAECAWKIEQGTLTLDVIIPPNTTALVSLPGSDSPAVEVGSGDWHWSFPYQDPDARESYTVDDLLGELMSDNAARDAILPVLEQAGAPGFLKAIIFNERNLRMRQVLHMLPNEAAAVALLNTALANLYPSRLQIAPFSIRRKAQFVTVDII